MTKRVFIVHRWDASPTDDWYPWLKVELEKLGFAVQVPAMPEPQAPKIENWVPYLAKVVGEVDERTYFVGHSVGCQIILRYLESLPAERKVGGAVFVAGWLRLVNLETEEERQIARPWLETPIDFAKVRQHTNQFRAIFSDNDQWVSTENKLLFEQQLGAQTLIEHHMGHFTVDDSIVELPSVLAAMQELVTM